MRVLFLGPARSPTAAYLREVGDDVTVTAGPITPETVLRRSTEYLVSNGYRHIIKPDVLDLVPGRAINLHISYLPWNRGADPNLWSWIDDTPKGVTIHYIHENVDTGDIIAQREVSFGAGETLASSSVRLQREMLERFAEHWPMIREGQCERRAQTGKSSVHRLVDRRSVEHLLASGWQTPVASLGGASE